jgi:hypothetical protein
VQLLHKNESVRCKERRTTTTHKNRHHINRMAAQKLDVADKILHLQPIISTAFIEQERACLGDFGPVSSAKLLS